MAPSAHADFQRGHYKFKRKSETDFGYNQHSKCTKPNSFFKEEESQLLVLKQYENSHAMDKRLLSKFRRKFRKSKNITY